MFDGQPYREEFQRRIATIRRLLDANQASIADTDGFDVSREVRGLTILLLFASYENLIKSLCRGILEKAARLRIGNRRLKIGFRQFAVYGHFESMTKSSRSKVWKTSGRELLECAFETRSCTINANRFPDDGSFMKSSQVRLLFEIFDLGDPGSVLKEIWPRLDAIVIERNNIAHGALIPSALWIDLSRPLEVGEGADASGLGDEAVPGAAAGIDDGPRAGEQPARQVAVS